MNKCTFRSIFLAGLLSFFLVNVANAWTIEQSNDSSSDGEKCPGWGSSKSVVSSDKSASGSNSCKLTITGDKSGFGQWGGIINFPSNLTVGDELWIRVRVYWPEQFDFTADPWLKFLRVRTNQADGSNRGYDDWYIQNRDNSVPFRHIYEGNRTYSWNTFGKLADQPQYGVWETYEYYIKFDTKAVIDGGKGRVRAWKNGVLLEDMTDRITLHAATDYAPSFYLFTYWNGNAPKTQSVYIDDVVVTNETPLNKDNFGNPAIGMGGFTSAPSVAPPKPPKIGQ